MLLKDIKYLFLRRKKLWGEETHENKEKQSVYI